MTGQQIDRDRLRELADEYDDSTIDGGPDMAAGAIRQLLDALDRAEAIIRRQERYIEGLESADIVGLKARAQRAEAQVKAVEDVLDRPADGTEDMDSISAHYANGYEIALQDIRRALDGEQ